MPSGPGSNRCPRPWPPFGPLGERRYGDFVEESEFCADVIVGECGSD